MSDCVVLRELHPGVWGICVDDSPAGSGPIIEKFVADMGSTLSGEDQTFMGHRYIKTRVARTVLLAAGYGAGKTQLNSVVQNAREKDAELARQNAAYRKARQEAERGERVDAKLKTCLPKTSWRKYDPKLDGLLARNDVLDGLPMRPVQDDVKEPWLNLPTLSARAKAAHEHATKMAQRTRPATKVDYGWNRRYREALQSIGFDVHAVVDDDKKLGTDDPIYAPRPAPAGMIYPWPSVVAPKDWSPSATGGK